jgi:hypothetical protein
VFTRYGDFVWILTESKKFINENLIKIEVNFRSFIFGKTLQKKPEEVTKSQKKAEGVR